MPVTFTIDAADRTVFSTASGVVTYREVIEHIERKVAAGVMDSRELFDARNITLGFSTSELRGIAGEAARVLGNRAPARLAIVTDSAFLQGCAHSYALFTGVIDYEFEVFCEVDEARSWLLKA